jgi:hypothetical protein
MWMKGRKPMNKQSSYCKAGLTYKQANFQANLFRQSVQVATCNPCLVKCQAWYTFTFALPHLASWIMQTTRCLRMSNKHFITSMLSQSMDLSEIVVSINLQVSYNKFAHKVVHRFVQVHSLINRWKLIFSNASATFIFILLLLKFGDQNLCFIQGYQGDTGKLLELMRYCDIGEKAEKMVTRG